MEAPPWCATLDGVRGRTLVVDAMLAGALAFIGVLGTWGAGQRPSGFKAVDGVAIGLAVVAALSLSVRRLWPLVTLTVVTLATSTYLALGYPYGPILLSFLVAVYTVARHLPLRRAAIASGAALLVLLVHLLIWSGPGLIGLIPGSAWVVVPFAVGTTMKLNRENADRARAELARKYADEERLRVAQEVHDVVGHGLSAINMQAEVALHLAERKPEQAQAALVAISRTSREALDELRVTLRLVRSAGEARAPLPGLARLDDLVQRMSETGVRVHLEVTGEKRALPTAIDLAVYRVVQESLTNVLRHAGTAPAVVRLGFEPEVVTVEVADAGTERPARFEEGHGLAGMRERVTALGGSVTAGPVAGGGFRVLARLPLT
ncbi:two-component sensor histidine kinase [Rhizocola hellebori]|uniref:histidine kinase n=1 Tax=Rhizocola hellebori TaxID=1392758 RepID=A0A8J3QHU2_9ACTN|nr:two-component sensor histidine kinase [Rhizocola hellebori]